MFLAPAFVTILSISSSASRSAGGGSRRWRLGFAGIMLVVKPGFRELHPGHFAAALTSPSPGRSA